MKRESCARCHRRMLPKASSAVDGRAQYTCPCCGYTWTNGKSVGEGYKDWPTYRPSQSDTEVKHD